MKTFIVTTHDSVLQCRDYVVIAEDKEHAIECIQGGHYLCESEATTIETYETDIVAIEEINETPKYRFTAQVQPTET